MLTLISFLSVRFFVIHLSLFFFRIRECFLYHEDIGVVFVQKD